MLMLVLVLMKTTRKTGERRQQKRMQEQRRRQSQSNLRRSRPRSALRRRGARMPENKKKELASKSLVAARQASDEDQDLRFTDSGVYGEGVEPCQDTRIADGSRPTRGLVQTRSRWSEGG